MGLSKIKNINVDIFKNVKGAKSGVMLLQEWWGITPQLRAQGSYIASHASGSTVLAVDLYDGTMTLDAAEAEHLMSNLDFPGALGKIEQVGRYLKEEEGVERLGVVGFCMGGALSAAASVKCTADSTKPLFDCGVTFYGVPPRELADCSTVTIPMQGHFGKLDGMEGFSCPKACGDLEQMWKEAGVEYEMFRYPKVGHAFLNDLEDSIQRKKDLGQIGGDCIHDPDAVKLAWQRTIDFLQKHRVLV